MHNHRPCSAHLQEGLHVLPGPVAAPVSPPLLRPRQRRLLCILLDDHALELPSPLGAPVLVLPPLLLVAALHLRRPSHTHACLSASLPVSGRHACTGGGSARYSGELMHGNKQRWVSGMARACMRGSRGEGQKPSVHERLHRFHSLVACAGSISCKVSSYPHLSPPSSSVHGRDCHDHVHELSKLLQCRVASSRHRLVAAWTRLSI